MPKASPAKRARTGSYTSTFANKAYVAKVNRKYSKRTTSNYAAALPEKKFFDTAISFLYDATAEVPATGQLSLIPQGDTESTRDGRRATIESVQLRLKLQFNIAAAAAPITGATRLALILDTQANGAAAAVTDVFQVDMLPEALLQLNNSGRFRILKMWTHRWETIAGATTAFATTAPVYLQYFKKCNIPMDWANTDGALTGIKSNNLFLMAQANSGQGNIDDLVACTGSCRLRFRG